MYIYKATVFQIGMVEESVVRVANPYSKRTLYLYPTRRLSSSSRRRQWRPTPVLLPGKSHGWRSLAGCSPWDLEESDTTERPHFHFSLSCIGEGNGNPLQCSCLENPRDGGAWWAAVYGVAQGQTWLKWLSSSSSSKYTWCHWTAYWEMYGYDDKP